MAMAKEQPAVPVDMEAVQEQREEARRAAEEEARENAQNPNLGPRDGHDMRNVRNAGGEVDENGVRREVTGTPQPGSSGGPGGPGNPNPAGQSEPK